MVRETVLEKLDLKSLEILNQRFWSESIGRSQFLKGHLDASIFDSIPKLQSRQIKFPQYFSHGVIFIFLNIRISVYRDTYLQPISDIESRPRVILGISKITYFELSEGTIPLLVYEFFYQQILEKMPNPLKCCRRTSREHTSLDDRPCGRGFGPIYRAIS